VTARRRRSVGADKVVTGYFAYHAVPTNGHALMAFRYHIINLWRRTLKMPGQKDKTTWDRITKLTDDWLPTPRILAPCIHSPHGSKVLYPT
jgi:RNA-directed DNA polymerase